MTLVKNTIVPVVFLFVALALYAVTFNYPFVFDTKAHVLLNPYLKDFFPWEAPVAKTRLMVHASLALNYLIGEFEPFSYRLFNVGIHFLNAWLLYAILKITFVKAQLFREREGAAVAFLTALVWLVHPLQTQSVTYVIQRSESMAALFYLGSMYAFILALGGSKKKSMWLGLSLICAFLGCMAKPSLVTLPVTLFFYDVIFSGSKPKKIFKQRGFFYLLLGFVWLFLYFLITSSTSPYLASAGFKASSVSVGHYFLTQFEVILHYLRLALWPSDLCLDYGWPFVQSVRNVWPEMAVISLLGLATLGLFLKRPKIGFWPFFFFLTLAPTSSIYPIFDAAMEHRMYMPLIGLLTLLVIVLFKLCEIVYERRKIEIFAVVCFCIVLSLSITTYVRNQTYKNEISIWRDTVAKQPGNERAKIALGNALFDEGKIKLAATQYKEILEGERDDPKALALAHYGLGNIAFQSQNYEKAKERYQKTIAIDQRMAQAYHNLGATYGALGNQKKAVEVYRKALEIKPNYKMAKKNLTMAKRMLKKKS